MQDDRELTNAHVERVQAGRLGWFLPLAALVFALYLAFDAWLGAGPTITIHAQAGYGVGVGDPLRFRGVNVGEVQEIGLTPGLERVALQVRLDPQAAGLCREGSRFWIVRPQMGLDSVEGLETIVGARYLSVQPGALDGPARYEFEALDESPVQELVEEAGLELRLESPGRKRLARGAQLTHRGIVVGTVLRTGLASDGSRVEVEAYVRPEFVDLIRGNTRFWSTGGLEVSMALAKGLSIEVDSLRSLVVGGIALATPTAAGPAAGDGDLFHLHDGPPADLDGWEPFLYVGPLEARELPPPTCLVPSTLSWSSGRLISSDSEREGWVLALPRGVLGLRELLVLPEDGQPEDGRLRAGERELALHTELLWEGQGMVLRAGPVEGIQPLGADQVRFAPKLQDCLVFAGVGAPPLSLSRSRMRRSPEGWQLERDLELDPNWNSALVWGLEDRRYVGLLILKEEDTRVVPFEAELW